MRQFILAVILALAALGSASVSTVEAQGLQRGTLFQNAYNRAPYYYLNNSASPSFGMGRYNNSYYNNPAPLNNNGRPGFGSPPIYYQNVPSLNNGFRAPPFYSGNRYYFYRQ